MEPDTCHDDQPARIFPRHRGIGPGWFFAGGIACLFFAAVGIALAFTRDVNQLTLQAVTTAPLILGVFALWRALALHNAPREIHLTDQGLALLYRNERREYPWDRLGFALGAFAVGGGKQLTLYDPQGAKLLTIPDSFADFDSLADTILNTVAAWDPQRQSQLAVKKSRRSAWFLAATGGFFLAMALLMAWMSWREQTDQKMLESSAVTGEAAILRRFLAPDGRTPRLEYLVTAPDGRKATRNAQLIRPYWDSLEDATTVPVRYVPDVPRVSRLVFGEAETDPMHKPAVGYVTAAVGSLLSLFLLAGAALQFRGYDIDFDSNTRKVSIKRFGQGR